MKLDPGLYHEQKLKWINDLNIIKFLEENLRENLHDLGIGKRFLDMSHERNNRQNGCIRIKIFSISSPSDHNAK